MAGCLNRVWCKRKKGRKEIRKGRVMFYQLQAENPRI